MGSFKKVQKYVFIFIELANWPATPAFACPPVRSRVVVVKVNSNFRTYLRTWLDRQTDRCLDIFQQTDKWEGKQMNRCLDIFQKNRKMYRQTDGQMFGHFSADRKMDR